MICYLYGITNLDNRLEAPLFASIERLACSQLAAIVEHVPDADFGPEILDQNLLSIDWVARTALRHEAVLSAAMAGGPVIPARLCTVFTDAGAVVQSLAGDHDRLSTTLRYLQSRSEWGLKVYLDAARLDAGIDDSDPKLRAIEEATIGASPGKVYLLTKKREARREELRRERTQEALDRVLDGLESLPISLHQRSLLAADITGRAEPMVLNVAALVSDDDLLAYHAEVQVLKAELAEEGFSIETSGPWPPYSFSQEAGEDDDEDASCEEGDLGDETDCRGGAGA